MNIIIVDARTFCLQRNFLKCLLYIYPGVACHLLFDEDIVRRHFALGFGRLRGNGGAFLRLAGGLARRCRATTGAGLRCGLAPGTRLGLRPLAAGSHGSRTQIVSTFRCRT